MPGDRLDSHADEKELKAQLQAFRLRLADNGIPVPADESLPVGEQLARLQDSVLTELSICHTEREALRHGEDRFRQLADAMPQLAWTANPDGSVDYANRWYDEYSGYRRNETDVIEWGPVLHPDDLEASARAWRHAVESGTPYQVEHRARRTDGSYRWLLTRASPVRDAQGRIIKWFGTSTDIHDLKTAQEALKRSEERLRLAQQVARIGTFEWNIKENVNEWTPEIEALYGMEPGAFGRTYEAWRACVHPDDRENAEQRVQEALVSGGFQAEWRTICPDGTIHWIAARAQIFRDESGNPLRMVGVNMDITDQKQAEEERERLSAQRQLALDAANLGWWTYDPASGTAFNDPRCLAILGIGESIRSIGEVLSRIHPDDRERVWAKVVAALNPAETSPYSDEFRIVRPDGSLCWTETYAIVSFDGEGQARHALRIVGTVADITGRKEAEERERRLTSMYRAHSEANEAILRLQDESALFPLICRIAVYYGGMLHAWVGVPDREGRLVPAASYGNAELYIRQITVMSTPGSAYGRGPGGTAFRENRPVIVNDAANDELTLPWKDLSAKYGIRAVSTYPILRGGTPHAILVVYSDRVDAFHDEIVQLLIDMAANISFALDNIDRETARRQAEEALRQSERQFRTLFEGAGDGIFIMDMTGRYVDVNERGARMLGYTRDEVLGMSTPDILPAHERNRLPPDWADWKKDHANHYVVSEWEFVRKDGSVFDGEANVTLLPDERHYMGIVRDISERKRTEASMKLAAMVYQESSEGMMITDADNRIIAVNPAFERITGYQAGDVIGKNPNILKSPRQDDTLYQSMWQAINETGRWKGEIWNRAKDGREFAESLAINTTYNPDGSVFRRVALFSDITEKKQSDDLIWHQANFDALTGLPNRNLFRDHLRHEIRNARRTNLPIALMFLDLDGFKDINDTLGHDMGDLLLKEVAGRLKRCVREIDTVARLGGDEFTVILSELHDAGNVDRIARHILREIARPVTLGDEIAHVSASIGITFYPQDASELESLLKNADQAMYAAKQGGRSRYHFFTQEMQEAALSRTRLVNDLRGALEGGQFEIAFQPIVDLNTGYVGKAEALIRWRHPERGLITPDEFISAAEETGLITSFGNWVMQEAVRQAARCRERHHPDFQISVNISPVQLRNGNISLSTWSGYLHQAGLSGDAIAIEVTEELLLDANEKARRQILDFRDAGIEVSLDDFGTGYSSLSYLKKFDIDYVKIDKMFVRNLTQGGDDRALCEAIIVMAHKLGVRVIAEGVENDDQARELADAGCDYAQGYLFSMPLSAQELDNLLPTGALYFPDDRTKHAAGTGPLASHSPRQPISPAGPP